MAVKIQVWNVWSYQFDRIGAGTCTFDRSLSSWRFGLAGNDELTQWLHWGRSCIDNQPGKLFRSCFRRHRPWMNLFWTSEPVPFPNLSPSQKQAWSAEPFLVGSRDCEIAKVSLTIWGNWLASFPVMVFFSCSYFQILPTVANLDVLLSSSTKAFLFATRRHS